MASSIIPGPLIRFQTCTRLRGRLLAKPERMRDSDTRARPQGRPVWCFFDFFLSETVRYPEDVPLKIAKQFAVQLSAGKKYRATLDTVVCCAAPGA